MTDRAQRPDTDRAQRILRRALIKIANDCGLRHDWARFLAVNLAAASATITEVIGSDRIMADGGEEVIKGATAQFESMLREDIAGRIAHEAGQTRQ
ncbi:hypothetical protein [Rhodopseudomonas palustris]|uniref:hypothetical protein n=1 Tax=Rhodopseudomonas palustris TaxID=1076 RepID=UPI000CEC15DA|nr:hypothetical protein [Rhodopseudomonas palustris]PPQ42139.1 hypothetical protein CKO39_18285 [Rhodopseudomonas palustris]